MLRALLSLLLAGALAAQATLSSIDWQADLAGATARARERGQPMLVLFRCET